MGNRVVQKWFRRMPCGQTPQPETLGPEFGSYQFAFSLPEIDFVFFADNSSVFPGQIREIEEHLKHYQVGKEGRKQKRTNVDYRCQ